MRDMRIYVTIHLFIRYYTGENRLGSTIIKINFTLCWDFISLCNVSLFHMSRLRVYVASLSIVISVAVLGIHEFKSLSFGDCVLSG